MAKKDRSAAKQLIIEALSARGMTVVAGTDDPKDADTPFVCARTEPLIPHGRLSVHVSLRGQGARPGDFVGGSYRVEILPEAIEKLAPESIAAFWLSDRSSTGTVPALVISRFAGHLRPELAANRLEIPFGDRGADTAVDLIVDTFDRYGEAELLAPLHSAAALRTSALVDLAGVNCRGLRSAATLLYAGGRADIGNELLAAYRDARWQRSESEDRLAAFQTWLKQVDESAWQDFRGNWRIPA